MYSVNPTPFAPYVLERAALQPMPINLSRYEQKRWVMFDQFIKHEQSYLKVMLTLQYSIYNPLLLDPDIVQADVLYAVFGTHQRICKLHLFIQPLLDVCVREWDDERLTGWLIWALLEQPSLMQLYSVFITHYKRTIELTKEYTNNHFASFITSNLRQFDARLHFEDYYSMTMQRIPQLVLEVKDLRKNTDESDPDCVLLERCVKLATTLGEQLNAAGGHNEIALAVLQATTHLHAGDNRIFRHDSYLCELLQMAPLNEMLNNGIKPRVVMLLSDRLVCAKRPKKTDQAGTSKQKTKYTKDELFGDIKWVVPLQNIQLVDEGLAHAGTLSTVANGFFEWIANIRVFGTFLHSQGYSRLNARNEQMDNMGSIALQKKDAPVAENLLRIQVKDSEKVYVLKLDNADAKKEWCNAIRLAKLALRPENSPAWWNSALYAPYEPLLVKTFDAGGQNATVTAGCSYVPNINSPAYSNQLFRVWSQKQHVVWISTIDKQHNNKITLYTHDRTRNVINLRASFSLSKVLIKCIAHVPEGMVGNNPADTVWIATPTRILIYSATFPMVAERLASVVLHGSSDLILYHAKHVFVATVSTCLYIFSMLANGMWNLKNLQQFHIGTVRAMTVVNAYVYIASDADIHVFDCSTGSFVQKIASRPTTFVRSIAFLRYSVHGLWVGYYQSGIISLYHAESYIHLLDIDIDKQIERFQLDNAEDRLTTLVSVTSLVVVDNILWVGTNVGILLSLHLPTCANVPIVIDEMQVAYHGHLQHVNVIMPLPSLRACEEITEILSHVKPTTVETLFMNTRKPSLDRIITSIHHQGFSMLYNTCSEIFYGALDISCSTVDDLTVSQEYNDCATSWNESEQKDQPEDRTASQLPWAPDSTLILTGGEGYVQRPYKPSPNTSSHGLNRSQSLSDISENFDKWQSTTIDKRGNLMLWEKRSKDLGQMKCEI
ncbi:rho guanine nucleotide exchange factor 10 [Anopheles marshallii]|uniref:rho guanine nucleotide exchange factor 10 n=1 Tax=Anopheles marshallii TaxID=1521116 RepID=UPI00237BF0D4|nr:rho guanine nucleotide exchange factor 10 [Anopheles marshallii]